eukprot:m.193039 g.193039  ORF g.193039 m.193039 type:complete len:2533 (-) comp14875_c0_seq1:808-8406(-)
MADRRSSTLASGSRASQSRAALLARRAMKGGSGGDDAEDDDAIAPIIHFGDQVSFYSAERCGFVASQLSPGAFSALGVVPCADKKRPGLGNIKTATFVLHPELKYTERRNLNRLIQACKKFPSEQITYEVALARADAAMSSRLPSTQELQEQKKLAEAEEDDNKGEMKRRIGGEVVYGQIVLLYHTHSQRYVRASTTLTSRTEASNMRVDLHPFGAKSAWFRVLPRYKVRSEGDPVRMNDQIVLESIMTSGQYLHTSLGSHPESEPDAKEFEVNVSVQPSSFTIFEHRDHTENSQVMIQGQAFAPVHGGSLVQFYHKEIGAYLAAQGSFVDHTPTEDVHLRVRPIKLQKPHSMVPPTATTTYWQFEFAHNAMMGRRLTWEVEMRIKHVPTQRYLMFETEGSKATLTNNPHDPRAVFQLFAVVDNGDIITADAYARIRHVQTGHWLHADDKQEYKRRKRTIVTPPNVSEELIQNTAGIKWDGARLCCLTLSESRNFDDAFIIRLVPDHYVYNTGFGVGMIKILQLYTTLRLQGQVSELFMSQVTRALVEFADFMFDNGERVRERQKLARTLQIVELIIKMLKSPFIPYNSGPSAITLEDLVKPTHRSTLAVMNAAYKVLETYLVGNSRKNELYIAAHIPFFQSQVGSELHVESMYTELVRDNSQIVHAITKSEIDAFVSLLQKDKQAHYLDFLGVLCECENAPLPDNQDLIAQALLKDTRSAVFLTEVNAQGDGVDVSMDGGATWISLQECSESGMDGDDATSTKEFLFLQKQLELFGKLSLGRNETSIAMIVQELKYLTWNECFLCICMRGVPDSLKANYIKLMIHLFIDVGDNRDVLDTVQLSFAWRSLRPNPYADAAQDKTKAITNAEFEQFEALSAWILEHLNGREKVTASARAENMLLAEVLNLLYYLVVFGYYVAPSDIASVMKPLRSVADGRNDQQTKSTTVRFAVSKGKGASANDWSQTTRFAKNGENAIVSRVKSRALKVIDALLNLCTTAQLQSLLLDFKCCQQEHEPTATFSRYSKLIAEVRDAADVQELYALTPQVRQYVRELTEESNWVTPNWHPIETTDDELTHTLLDLTQYQYESLLLRSTSLLHRLYSSRNDLFDLAIQTQILATDVSESIHTTLEQFLPALRRLTMGFIEDAEVDEYLGYVTQLTKLCYIEPSNPQSEPHSINQAIIYNSGLLNVLFDVISRDGQPPEVLNATFRLFRALALHHAPVQQAMFDRLTDFFCQTSVTGWHDSAAFALQEVFTLNHKLCLNIRLSDLELFMGVLQNHTTSVPYVLSLLAAVVKVEELDLPLKRNQNMIVKFLMEYRGQVIAPAYIDDQSDPEINAQRLALLRNSFASGEELKLQQYHCLLVSLLAACAEGENMYIESMCQTIFKVDEILDVLEDDVIDTVLKGPYLEFLHWAYLNTGQVSEALHEANLPENLRMWKSLASMMSSPMFRSTSPLNASEFKFVFQAYIPALTKLVKSFFSESSPKAVMGIVSDIASRLASFASSYLPVMSKRDAIKKLGNCLAALSSCVPNVIPIEVLQKVGTRMTTDEAGLTTSPAVAKFNRDYRAELLLNTSFNSFATKLKTAYNGENTIEAQLLTTRFGSVDTTEPYCEELDEDEPLPLSPEFQQQLSLYVEYDTVNGCNVPVRTTKFAKQLIRHIQSTAEEDAELDSKAQAMRDKYNMRTLTLLRACLHNIYVLEQDGSSLQDELAPAVLPVANMLSEPSSEIVRECLACLVAFLTDGHKSAQEQFETYFFTTREELFFEVVQKRIRTSLERMTELRALRLQDAANKKMQENVTGTLTMAGKLHGVAGHLKAVEETDVDNPVETVALAQNEASLDIRDDANIELVLRVMQFMCEGFNLKLKSYLQSQPDNIRSIDLVALTVEFLQTLIEEVNAENIDLIIQCLETLVELSQGFAPNQKSIFDAHVMDHINHLLRLPVYPNCPDWKVGRVKYAIAKLLMSFMENNDARTLEMALQVEETLDIPAINDHVLFYQDLHSKNTDKLWREEADDDEDEVASPLVIGYEFYTVLVRLQDFTDTNYLLLPEYHRSDVEVVRDRVKNPAAQFFEKNTASVEIARDGELHRVYFFNHWKNRINDDVKSDIIWTVDRTSPSDKISDFVDKCKTVIADTRYWERVKNLSFFTSLLINYKNWWDRGLLIMTIVLNIVMLIAWRAPERDGDGNYVILPQIDEKYMTALYALGGIQAFFSLLVFLAFFIINPPSFKASFAWFLPADGAAEESHNSEHSIFGAMQLYYLLLVPMSALGIKYSGYFFCYHLFHIVIGNDILLRVMQAVTKNGQSLLWVALLMCIVIYTYSFITFAALREEYSVPDGYHCETLLECFVTNLKWGLLNGGGLGEGLGFPESQAFGAFTVRSVFDLSFFIIITIIGLNVVFGIIVDTFSELRDEKYQIEEAMASECFICGRKAYDFERFGNGFDQHIKKEHNMWSYLFFFLHLATKDPNDFSSHEFYVHSLLQDHEEKAAFPQGQALALGAREDEADVIDELRNELAALRQDVVAALQIMTSQAQK